MRKHPWLHQRSGVFYLRAIVPTDLIDTLGKREIWRSLRTSQRAEADGLIQAEAAKVQLEFARQRAQKTNSPPVVNRQYLEFIAQKYAQRLDQKRQNWPSAVQRYTSPALWPFSNMREATAAYLAMYEDYVAADDFTDMADEVDELLTEHGIAFPRGSNEW